MAQKRSRTIASKDYFQVTSAILNQLFASFIFQVGNKVKQGVDENQFLFYFNIAKIKLLTYSWSIAIDNYQKFGPKVHFSLWNIDLTLMKSKTFSNTFDIKIPSKLSCHMSFEHTFTAVHFIFEWIKLVLDTWLLSTLLNYFAGFALLINLKLRIPKPVF